MTLDRPRHVAQVAALFEPQVVHVSVMNNRLTATGFAAFGYPERVYGYDTIMEIALEDIPQLIQEAEKRGFSLSAVHDTSDGVEISDDTQSFTYSIPGAKTWLDFRESRV